jgi:hypothetical protein
MRVDEAYTWGGDCCGFLLGGGRVVASHFRQIDLLFIPLDSCYHRRYLELTISVWKKLGL